MTNLFLGATVESWVVGFFMVFTMLIAYVVMDFRFIHVLKTKGMYKTRKGVYTWTPKGDNQK